jgi:hypothetical protein
MVEFHNIHVGDWIYVVETNPVAILKLMVVSVGYDLEYHKILKVVHDDDLILEIDFVDLGGLVFSNKELAYATATKYVFDDTNKYIRELSNGYFSDYFDLNRSLERYKMSHPEIFI